MSKAGVSAPVWLKERTAYRYAGITLTIVMLASRSLPPWVIAIHRFVEISVGIVVGLLITVAGPETKPAAK